MKDYLELMSHNQHFKWTKIHYNSLVCIDSVPPQRERACLDLLWIYESVKRTLSRTVNVISIQKCTGLK